MKYLTFLLVFLTSFAMAQNPQSHTAPIYDVNSKYVNGVAPGYAPTMGRALNLNLGSGTVLCSSGIQQYTGGVVVLNPNTTNYVYLDTTNNCLPTVGTVAFTNTQFPIAIVITTSVITNINDVRTFFNALVAGQAANPAPPSFAVQLANNGATSFQADSTILINPTLHSFVAPISNGLAYTTGFGDGSTTGITSCAAAGQVTCVAPPTYGSTEQYSPTSTIPNWPSNFVFEDNRTGHFGYIFHNWGSTNQSTPLYGDGTYPATLFYGQLDGTPNANAGDIQQNVVSSTLNTTTPGFSIGFPVGFTGEGWQISRALTLIQNANGSGIAQTANSTLNKYGVGDAITLYCYLFGSGGWTAPSDENEKCISANTNEDPNVYTGTCTGGGCTTGSTQFATTPVHAAGHQGTQRYLIDITQTPTQTSVTAIAPSGLDPTHMSAVTVSGTIPISTAWGTIPTVNTPNSTVPPFTTSETFNVTIVGGTSGTSSAFTTGVACFSSMYHDQAMITAAPAPVAGVQSITIAAHKQHASGSYLFQGGECATGMEFPSYTKVISGVTYRYLFDIVGSTDAHTLQAIEWFTGQAQPLTKYGQNFNVGGALYGCFNASLSSSGTTVTGTFLSFCASNYGIPSQYNLAPLYLSGNSDTSLNGNCTGTVWSSASLFICTNASLTGTHTSTSSVAQLSQGSLLGLNNINLWPMTAVLDVQNETTTPPTVDGTFTVEPNNMVIAANDTLEEPHHLSMNMNGEVINKNTVDPFDQGSGLSVSMLNNPQGGNSSLASSAALNLFIGATDTNYIGLGGTEIPPNGINLSGPTYITINIDHAPAPNQYVLDIKPRAAQLNNVNFCFNLWGISHLSGSSSFQDCPNSGNNALQTGGNLSFTAGGTATYTATSHTFSGGLTANGANQFAGTNLINGATITTVGGFISGNGYNFAPYSNTLNAITWQNAALGTGTTTCTITDDLGHPACTISGTINYDWQDSNTASYTALTLNASYTVQARMQGAVGGEQIGFGADFLGQTVTLTTTWTDYCVPITASNNSGLKNFADINLTSTATINVSNVVVRPGPTCGPLLITHNNQFTTLTSINQIPNLTVNMIQPGMLYSAAGTPLASCTSNILGQLSVVSDATAPTYLGNYTSGGAVVAPVMCNGTNWVTY